MKRVFGFSTLLFIAVIPFLSDKSDKSIFLLQDLTVFSLVTGLFWLLFLYRILQVSFYRLLCFCCICWYSVMSQLFEAIFNFVSQIISYIYHYLETNQELPEK